MDDLNTPATKGDILQVKQQVRDDIQQVKQQVKDEMQQVKDELVETIRDVQTEMLKAFYSYGQTADLRMKDAESANHNLRDRISAAESRITEIERRLNMPPAA